MLSAGEGLRSVQDQLSPHRGPVSPAGSTVLGRRHCELRSARLANKTINRRGGSLWPPAGVGRGATPIPQNRMISHTGRNPRVGMSLKPSLALRVAIPWDGLHASRSNRSAAGPIGRFPLGQVAHASTQHSQHIAGQTGGICQLPATMRVGADAPCDARSARRAAGERPAAQSALAGSMGARETERPRVDDVRAAGAGVRPVVRNTGAPAGAASSVRDCLRWSPAVLRCVQHISTGPRRGSARTGVHRRRRTSFALGSDGLARHPRCDGRCHLGMAQAAHGGAEHTYSPCVSGGVRRCPCKRGH